MRTRPLRPHIYRPLTFAGVLLADVKFIVGVAALCYAVPFFLDLSFHNFPLAIPSALVASAGAIAFFNWARRGRRPNWLNHKIEAALTRAEYRRRALPVDRHREPPNWLIS